MVSTHFATGRAMFVHWMFSNRALGEQWVQRATKRADGNGRQVASRKLEAGRVVDDRTERLQPGRKGAGTIDYIRKSTVQYGESQIILICVYLFEMYGAG